MCTQNNVSGIELMELRCKLQNYDSILVKNYGVSNCTFDGQYDANVHLPFIGLLKLVYTILIGVYVSF